MSIIEINGKEMAKVVAIPHEILQPNGFFDRVEDLERKKPESDNPGIYKSRNSSPEFDRLDLDNPSLSEPTNFYKKSYGSVSERFIKYIPCEKASWLRSKYPFAFLLLNLIAERARRSEGSFDGLELGESHIGDHESIGASRQQYRTALKVLTDHKIIKIIETCRNRKKSTTGTTTRGTKVKLLNSEIWDINIEPTNHQSNHRPTTDQPPTNQEQERRKNEERIDISSEKGTFVPSSFATSLLSDFYSSLFLSIPDFPKDSAKKTKSQYQAAERLLKKYSMEELKTIITYAHTPGGFWIAHVHSLTYLEKKIVKLKEQMKNPFPSRQAPAKPSRHNNPNFAPKEQKPLAFNNKISFKDCT